jgi:hypothetical protein
MYVYTWKFIYIQREHERSEVTFRTQTSWYTCSFLGTWMQFVSARIRRNLFACLKKRAISRNRHPRSVGTRTADTSKCDEPQREKFKFAALNYLFFVCDRLVSERESNEKNLEHKISSYIIHSGLVWFTFH